MFSSLVAESLHELGESVDHIVTFGRLYETTQWTTMLWITCLGLGHKSGGLLHHRWSVVLIIATTIMEVGNEEWTTPSPSEGG